MDNDRLQKYSGTLGKVVGYIIWVALAIFFMLCFIGIVRMMARWALG